MTSVPGHHLTANALSCDRGFARLFRDVGFTVTSGSCTQLNGPNGVGKTTLLRILAGISLPKAGSVLWNDQPIERLGRQWGRQVAYVGHTVALKDELTVLENLAEIVTLEQGSARAESLAAAVARAGLERRSKLVARVLSQGQRRRLAMAYLMLTQRRVWLLDEPTTGLDAAGSALLAELLGEHLSSGGMAIVTSHQGLGIPVTHVELG